MDLVFEAVGEESPGDKWQALFRARWPAYKAWYLSGGIEARPTYLTCVTALRRHMPELMPIYERLCTLAGGFDLAARFLSLYRPPAYISGCSQVVWQGDEPVLIRNYDYAPQLCDGLIPNTRWSGSRVIASVDCLWGCLDGVNETGLVVSLSFGGRPAVGDGFGILVVLRYVPEFCRTSSEAADVLRRVPTHMAYNVTGVDRTGAFFTAYLSPGRPAEIGKVPVATNHQREIEWHRHAQATASAERERYLSRLLVEPTITAQRLADAFLRPPFTQGPVDAASEPCTRQSIDQCAAKSNTAGRTCPGPFRSPPSRKACNAFGSCRRPPDRWRGVASKQGWKHEGRHPRKRCGRHGRRLVSRQGRS